MGLTPWFIPPRFYDSRLGRHFSGAPTKTSVNCKETIKQFLIENLKYFCLVRSVTVHGALTLRFLRNFRKLTVKKTTELNIKIFAKFSKIGCKKTTELGNSP